MEPRSLLITGGAGFIGSNFVHYWIGKYPQTRVVVLDALTYAGNPENLASVLEKQTLRFVHGDIQDEKLVEGLIREEGIDAIVHFAAESHVDRSILGPDLFLETNVTGTHNLLKCAKKNWIDKNKNPGEFRFHHVSTDEVYGSLAAGDPAFTEKSPYDPSSPYAASKASSDHLVRAYHRTYGLDVTISNCSNNYGPYHFPEKLIPLMILNILQGEGLPVYGDGSNVRDWLYVEDHCEGIDLVLRNGQSGETYNIGGNNELKNIDLVKSICRELDNIFAGNNDLKQQYPACPASSGQKSETLIHYVKDRPGHDFRYAINAEKIRSQLGFGPRYRAVEGITKTINWFLDNESWWRNVLDDSYRDWIARQYQ